jgi:hypothetical protein
MNELKKMCAETRAQGGSSLYLKVNQTRAPRNPRVRVAGFGNGTIINWNQLPDGSYDLTCMFKLSTVEKNIAKHEMGVKFK